MGGDHATAKFLLLLSLCILPAGIGSKVIDLELGRQGRRLRCKDLLFHFARKMSEKCMG